MWWFAALHANLLDLFRRAVAQGDARNTGLKPLLDAGCGTGGLLAALARAYPERTVVGLDADLFAVTRARRKSGSPVCVGSVNALPFADSTFGAIISADVLCHRDVDEMGALDQFHRCLVQRGLLVLNLPAYQWMLSRHDAAVANVRRYSRGLMQALLKATGFRLLEISYWNAMLFPVMAASRKLLPARTRRSDVAVHCSAFDRIGRIATGFERRLLQRRLHLPFGGSIIAAAVKEGGVNA